ncbi:MAG: hypothetical protein NUK62_08125 [Tenericutes bacterium]|nr:hypothetical protein [Mycoplasmatota bacterium]
MKKYFERLKKLYKTRDINSVEKIVDQLYHNHFLPVLIGTSNGELYYQKEDAIKLFKDDLEGWGDVEIDIDSFNEQTYGPYQVSRCLSTIKQTFNVDVATYDRFYNIVNDIKASNEGSDYQKLMLIQQLLVHLMHDRKEGTRTYLWDMYLDMITRNDKCLLLQFSLPIDSYCPDVRVDDFETYNKSLYEKEIKIVEKIKDKSPIQLELQKVLEPIVMKEQEAEQVTFNDSIAIIDQKNDYFCFIAIGKYQKTVSLDQRLSLLMSKRYEDMDSKRALFSLRRDIASHLLHDAIGESMDIHFRMIGIGVMKQNGIDILYHQITLPFNLILEEKTDAAIVL